MMVMAMMTAAISQAAAIHAPPIRIQRMFRSIETGAMRFLLTWNARVALRRHCEEPTGPAFGRPDDKLRDEAIHSSFVAPWIASRSLSSGAHSRDPLARNDDLSTLASWLSEN